MKYNFTLLTVCLIFFWSSKVIAQNEPDQASIYISRTYIRLNFSWDKINPNIEREYVGFAQDRAIEFQISIDTSPFQKCFGLPIGGKDNLINYADNNLPGREYTDVWNIYFPSNPSEINASLIINCQGIGIGNSSIVSIVGALVDRYLESQQDRMGRGLDDSILNFAVGTKDAFLLERGIDYSIIYPLEIPINEECMHQEAGWGYSKISMQILPNTCTLGIHPLEFTVTCPHLLGLDFERSGIQLGCKEENPEGLQRTWITKLCVPTLFWEFNPTNDSLEIDDGECVDRDGDHLFKSSYDYIMYGTNAGDCLDDPEQNGSAVDNTSYNPDFGICVGVHCRTTDDCIDDNVCDGPTYCVNGYCRESFPISCRFDEHCDPILGCVEDECVQDLDCSDDNACNGVEQCSDGRCINRFPISCNRNERCEPEYGCVPDCFPNCQPICPPNNCTPECASSVRPHQGSFVWSPSSNGRIYFVNDGLAYHILDVPCWRLFDPELNPPTCITDALLEDITFDGPSICDDGSFVKRAGESTFYLLQAGELYPLCGPWSPDALNQEYGHGFELAVTAPERFFVRYTTAVGEGIYPPGARAPQCGDPLHECGTIIDLEEICYVELRCGACTGEGEECLNHTCVDDGEEPPLVAPTLRVAPVEGPAGTVFRHEGRGFTPNSEAELHIVIPSRDFLQEIVKIFLYKVVRYKINSIK